MTEIVYNKNGIPFDIDAIATDLNGKADVDLTNVNDTGTSKVAGWAMPSTVYDTLTLGASGSTYTAPANGYFYCFYRAPYDNSMTNETNGILYCTGVYGSTNANQPQTYLISVTKGDVISIYLNSTPTDVTFRFYYAEGSKEEA